MGEGLGEGLLLINTFDSLDLAISTPLDRANLEAAKP